MSGFSDSFYWDEVSGEHDRLQHTSALMHAKVASAAYWPFLASAHNDSDFANRLFIVSERLEDKVGPDLLPEVLSSLTDDYKAVKTAEKGGKPWDQDEDDSVKDESKKAEDQADDETDASKDDDKDKKKNEKDEDDSQEDGSDDGEGKSESDDDGDDKSKGGQPNWLSDEDRTKNSGDKQKSEKAKKDNKNASKTADMYGRMKPTTFHHSDGSDFYDLGYSHGHAGKEPKYTGHEDYLQGHLHGRSDREVEDVMGYPTSHNTASKTAGTYVPDPSDAQRYYKPYESLESLPLNNGDLQGPDGYIKDLAEGEQRTPEAYARQTTPGTWTQGEGMPERPMPQGVARGYQPVASLDSDGYVVERKVATRTYIDADGFLVEALVDPAPGTPQQANPFYFNGPALEGNGFPQDPWGGVVEDRVNDFYGDVPPQQSSGSTEGQVDGAGYTRSQPGNHTAGYHQQRSLRDSGQPGVSPAYDDRGELFKNHADEDGGLDPAGQAEYNAHHEYYNGNAKPWSPIEEAKSQDQGPMHPFYEQQKRNASQGPRNFSRTASGHWLEGLRLGREHRQNGVEFRGGDYQKEVDSRGDSEGKDFAHGYSVGHPHSGVTPGSDLDNRYASITAENHFLHGHYDAQMGRPYAGEENQNSEEAHTYRQGWNAFHAQNDVQRGHAQDDRAFQQSLFGHAGSKTALIEELPEIAEAAEGGRGIPSVPNVAGGQDKNDASKPAVDDWQDQFLHSQSSIGWGHDTADHGSAWSFGDALNFSQANYTTTLGLDKEGFLVESADYIGRPDANNPTGRGGDEYKARTWDAFTTQHPMQSAEDRNVNTPVLPQGGIQTRNIGAENPQFDRSRTDHLEQSDDDEDDED